MFTYRKVIPIVMIMFLLLSVLIAMNYQANGITDNRLPLAKKYFPDAELLWAREFDGILEDFVIAKRSGHVAIGSISSDEEKEGKVYYFESTGKLLWEISNKTATDLQKIAIIDIQVSENGETILVGWTGDYESSEKHVYDQSGELLYRKQGEWGTTYRLSPQGKYIVAGGDQLLNREGEPIEFAIPGLEGDWGYHYSFISDNRLVVHAGEKISFEARRKAMRGLISRPQGQVDLYFLTFPECEIIWKKELGKNRSAVVMGLNGIFIINAPPSNGKDWTGYCYRKQNGECLWMKESIPRGIVTLFDRNEYIGLFCQGANIRGLFLVDSKTGEIVSSYPFPKDKMFSQTRAYSFWGFNGKIFLSDEIQFLLPEPRILKCTLVWDIDKDGKIIEETTEDGIIIGFSGSSVIGIFENSVAMRVTDDQEKRDNFSINILSIKGGELR